MIGGRSCRLKTSGDPLHAQEKEHYYLLDALGDSRFDAKSDRLLAETTCFVEKLLVDPDTWDNYSQFSLTRTYAYDGATSTLPERLVLRFFP